MSLILDALNRADQERHAEAQAPNLQSAYVGLGTRHHPFKRWMIEAVIVIAALGFGGYWFLQQSLPVTDSEQQLSSPPTAAITTGAPPIANPPPLPKPKANAVKPVIANSQALPAPQSITQPVSQSTAIEALYQQPPTAPAAEPAQAPQAKPSTPDSKPLDTSQSILESIPLLSQQSLHFQQTVPSIEYSMHVYAEQGGFVVLNGKRMRVGDQLTPQLRVLAILKNSLVLDYNNRQFRLMALNSWISF